MSTPASLLARANQQCELCESPDDLDAVTVPPGEEQVLVCGACRSAMEADPLDPNDWFALQGSIWSAVPAVQVLSWRLLERLGEGWPQETLDSGALDEDTLRWARDVPEAGVQVVDSNGNRLQDGDSVTLIKDLDVKGAGFTAKRGTLVKGIRLGDDPTHVEGRVNKVAIYLKTDFLKKV